MAYERTAQIAHDAAVRSKTSVRDRFVYLWRAMPALLQTAFAAGLAWFAGHEALGHPKPFVAPVSAIVALGLTYGQRTQRAIEIVAGVTLGVLIADVIAATLGVGALQIGLVVGLAMVAAVLLGGRQVSFDRALDALVGGVIALIVNLVLFPVDPVRLARRYVGPLLAELAAVLRDLAKALEDRDHDAAEDALVRARGLDPLSASLIEAISAGSETALWSPFRRRRRGEHARYDQAAIHLDLAVRNVRVLARGAMRALELDARVPPEALHALRELASGVNALAPSLEDPARAARAREHALQAAGEATLALEATGNLSASVIVGQVRSMATDLLRGLGVAGDEARDAVRHAADDAASTP